MRSILPGIGTASTLELVEATSAIAAELAGREVPAPGMAALELAESLGSAIDVLEAALASLVARVDDTGAFGELGYSSTGAWLRGRLGMRDRRAAERDLRAPTRETPRSTAVPNPALAPATQTEILLRPALGTSSVSTFPGPNVSGPPPGC